MPSCHDMKKGDIYMCEECGLELQVIKECHDDELHEGDCACNDPQSNACVFKCCDLEMVHKAAR